MSTRPAGHPEPAPAHETSPHDTSQPEWIGLHMAFRCRYDDRRTIDIVTAACTRITGYTIEEVLQSRFGLLDITDPRDAESVHDEVRQSLLQFKPLEIRYRILTKTGTSVWVTEHSGPSVGPDGRIVFTGFIEMLRSGPTP